MDNQIVYAASPFVLYVGYLIMRRIVGWLSDNGVSRTETLNMARASMNAAERLKNPEIRQEQIAENLGISLRAVEDADVHLRELESGGENQGWYEVRLLDQQARNLSDLAHMAVTRTLPVPTDASPTKKKPRRGKE